MQVIDNLTIGEIKEINKLFGERSRHGLQNPAGKICIVVLQRGWVVVGQTQVDSGCVVIGDAHCIRKWGTTRGLGQIAIDGPTKDTVLDKSGTIRCHELGIVALFDCNQEAWRCKLTA